ncbi:MAG: tRNA-uridine aminocarboxypropyltransferase [Myxococcota bacterium]|nr:tRNA-uridine aminocarboxypropyltransferase [Myxococcota bacterium]
MRERCSGCQRPVSVCLCAALVSLKNRVPVRVLQHPKERKHALGTVWIAEKMLSQIFVHSFSSGQSMDWLQMPSLSLLFPAPDAQPLEAFPEDGTLLVLDGTWDQVRGMMAAESVLRHLPTYRFASPEPSRYRIRSSRQPGGLSSLEAIAWALEVIENRKGFYEPLRNAMDRMVAYQIEAMGEEIYRRNYGGAS